MHILRIGTDDDQRAPFGASVLELGAPGLAGWLRQAVCAV